jgi:hypothetical protein
MHPAFAAHLRVKSFENTAKFGMIPSRNRAAPSRQGRSRAMELITVTYNERPFAVVQVGRRPAEAIARARALVEAQGHGGGGFGEDEGRFGTRAPTGEETLGWFVCCSDCLPAGAPAALPAAPAARLAAASRG